MGLSIEISGFSCLALDLNFLAALLELNREPSKMNEGIGSSSGPESWDSFTSGPNFLSEGALGGDIEFDLSSHVLPFELLVLSDVGADHSADKPLV